MTSQEYKKLKMPDGPGVYFFMKGKVILYIGKATSLRSRVQSYFSNDLINMRGMFLVDMVTQADSIKWQETDSVLEALILEADLIKTHQPKYNTKEKDGKSFMCVVITDEPMPQVLMVRKKNIDFKNKKIFRKTISKQQKANTLNLQAVFGPFTNGSQLKEAMRIVRRIFPYRDDASSKRDNYEFYRQLGLTPDVSAGEKMSLSKTATENFAWSDSGPKIFADKRGDRRKSTSGLREGYFSEGPFFEYKKNINNLKLFFQGKKKKIITNLKKEMLAYAKVKEFEKANDIKKIIFALTHINDIALIKNDNSIFPANNTSLQPLPSFQREGRLSSKIFAQSGDQAKFSAAVSDKYSLPSKSDFDKSFPALQNEHTIRIEAYDIAHLSGKDMVGVMTVINAVIPAYRGAQEQFELNKDEYRKFKIKSVQGANDPAALAEVLTRRLGHATWELPNIIVVDGNEVQKNVAEKIIKEKGFNIPVVALVKDDKHKARGLIGPKGIVTAHKQAITLVNNEAHRFAILYHKLKRGKSFLK